MYPQTSGFTDRFYFRRIDEEVDGRSGDQICDRENPLPHEGTDACDAYDAWTAAQQPTPEPVNEPATAPEPSSMPEPATAPEPSSMPEPASVPEPSPAEEPEAENDSASAIMMGSLVPLALALQWLL